MKRVEAYCEKMHMIKPGDGIVIGLSGGADSVCLLLFLRALSEVYKLKLHAVHVNHHIRGKQADADALFCKQLCEEYGISFEQIDVDVPALSKEQNMTEEEAGRYARYQAFQRVLVQRGYQKIAVAHHKQDLAETMLFHMARGTGISGLTSMKPVSGVIIRPLLELTRTEIEEILTTRKVKYCVDITNHDVTYSRNRIRKCVIPELTRVNARALEHFSSLSEQMTLLQDFVRQSMNEVYPICVLEEEMGYRIVLEEFAKQHEYLQCELVKTIICKLAGTAKDISSSHIRDVQRLQQSQSGKHIFLPYHIEAVREYAYIYMHTGQDNFDNSWENTLNIDWSNIYLPDGSELVFKKVQNVSDIEHKKQYTKYFDCDKITNALVVRYPRTTDYIVMDTKGHKKMLNRYFIDAKIPAHERGRCLVVADGDLVLWVLGYRTSECARITDETKQMIQITWVKKGNANDGED